MAVRAPHLEHQLPDLALPRDEGWAEAGAWAAVPIPPDRLDHMVRDTPSWTLWDPGVVGVDVLEGRAGEPGMVSRLTVGNRRWSQPLIHMLVASSDMTSIFAGAGPRWYFIETIRLTPRGATATRIERTVQVRLCGAARWATIPFRFLIARHLRRSLRALT